MITISFYNYTDDPRKVGKTLPAATVLEGELYETFDICAPSVKVRMSEVPKYNYAYIEALNRYYFVENIEFVGAGVFEFSLSVDVLQTYAEAIKAATATMLQTDIQDNYTSNRENVYNKQPQIEKVSFPNTGLLNTEGKIVMVTIKGQTA